jgi:hypothetical protein
MFGTVADPTYVQWLGDGNGKSYLENDIEYCNALGLRPLK